MNYDEIRKKILANTNLEEQDLNRMTKSDIFQAYLDSESEPNRGERILDAVETIFGVRLVRNFKIETVARGTVIMSYPLYGLIVTVDGEKKPYDVAECTKEGYARLEKVMNGACPFDDAEIIRFY